jgi:sn-glycerol 3-phosphate transport system permease protein
MPTAELDTAEVSPEPSSPFPVRTRPSLRHLAGNAVSYVVLTTLSLVVLLPIWLTFVRAVSPPFVYIEEGQPFRPVQPDWGVFGDAWAEGNLGRAMLITITMSVIITVAQLTTSIMAAYAFAFLQFPLKRLLMVVVLATMLLPLEVTLVANVRTIRELGWLDSMQGLTAPALASAFGIFLLRQSFIGVPGDLHDAAKLDGFSHFQFVRRVVMPLNRPAIGSLALITMLTAWNSYLWPRAVTIAPEWNTLQLVLRQVAQQQPDRLNLGVAAAIISAIPVLLLLIFFQKQIIRGLTAGAVKG